MSAKMLSTKLERYIDEPNWGPEAQKALKLSHEYEKWSYRMLNIMLFRFIGCHPKGLVNDLAQDLQDRLKSLEPGGEFLVPVNLRPKNVGGFHTITVKMKKDLDGTFSFTVYNVGMGCEEHHSDLTHYKKIVPFRISHISESKITDLNFLCQFIDQATFRKFDDRSASSFYKFLKDKQTWGAGAQINLRESEGGQPMASRSLQRSGTCIWKSPLTALKDSISPAAYKAFIFAMKRDNIFDLYNQYLAKELEQKIRNPAQSNMEWQSQTKEARLLVEIGIDEFHKRIRKS